MFSTERKLPSMSYASSVLRALFSLKQREARVGVRAIVRAVGGTPSHVRVALRQLEAAGLVTRAAPSDVRLTMMGLVVAASAVAPLARRARTTVSRAA